MAASDSGRWREWRAWPRSTVSTLQRSPRYRPDVEGLRAVAVAAVLAYHAFPAFLTGGFVGVDVFFVISGYVITLLILDGLGDRAFSAGAFYARRIRRLVPALLVVLGVCGVFGWLVLTPSELIWLGRSSAFGAAFLGNSMWTVGGDYFEQTSYSNPLRHLWSLAVEEQFYILWPWLLIVSVKRGMTVRALIAVIASSLAISIWGSWDDPATHFYHLSCRAWELAVGGLLAVSVGQRSDQGSLRAGPTQHRAGLRMQVASFAGLALVIFGCVFLNGDVNLPGWRNAIPTGGAALLIWAGPQGWINRCFLSRGPLTLVGRISYSLYLWHWPTLAFACILLGHALSPTQAAAALVISFLAAAVTYIVVESPLRNANCGRKAVAGLVAMLAGFCLVGTAAALRWIPARLAGPALASFDRAKFDWDFPDEFNSGKRSGFRPWVIPGRRKQRVLFIGDSHVEQYWSRVAAVVKSHPDSARTAEFVTYVGCPPLPGVNVRQRGAWCNEFFQYAREQSFHADVDTVVFGAFWEAYLLGEFEAGAARHDIYRVADPLRRPLDVGSSATRSVFDDFEHLVTQLVASGRRVFIILSNPTSPLFVPNSMLPAAVRLARDAPARIEVDSERRRVDVSQFEVFVAPVTSRLRAIAERSGAIAVDPGGTLCDGMLCAAVTRNGTPIYLDSNHLRSFFVRERALFLDQMVLGPDAQAFVGMLP